MKSSLMKLLVPGAVLLGLLQCLDGLNALASAVEEQAAKQLATQLLSQFRKDAKVASGARFSARNCPRIPPGKWVALILLNEPVEHELKFAPGCDLQGKITLKRDRFPVNLQVRKIEGMDRVKGWMVPDYKTEMMKRQIQILTRFERGQLFQKKPKEIMGFEADYQVVLGMDGKVKENRGGTLRLQRYQGTPIKLQLPLHFEES